MDRRLLDIILCPACGGTLELGDTSSTTIRYSDGEKEEVQSGTASCRCGRRYPIADYVLSFAEVFSSVLRQEAAYWDRYYLWLLEQDSFGFHDLERGHAPYITFGVPEPFPPTDTLDLYDVHHQVAEHPLLRKGHTLLDIGVGLGWTALYLARAGYAVTAFEPSLGPVTAAKRYAMDQGVFIEYVCGAMGVMQFLPCSFDNVTAFHSLHHVPDLEAALLQIRSWLCPGGALAIDEHTGNSRIAAALGAELHAWAEVEVFPGYRTLSPEALSNLPAEPHSALEDSSATDILPFVNKLFKVELARPRHVFLDHYALLYYLYADRNLAAYNHALAIANHFQDLVRRIDPDGADYVTIIAENAGQDAGCAEQESAQNQPRSDEAPVKLELSSFDSHAQVAELEAHLVAQAAWARGLERELQSKNAELARLRTLVRKLENGRVMRLLRSFSLNGNSRTHRRGR